MEFDPTIQSFVPDTFDVKHLGICQPVPRHNVYQMGRLVAKNLRAVEQDGCDPPARPSGIRAAENLGLLCLHTDPKILLQRVKESSESQL